MELTGTSPETKKALAFTVAVATEKSRACCRAVAALQTRLESAGLTTTGDGVGSVLFLP
jgi:hypothetical protein